MPLGVHALRHMASWAGQSHAHMASWESQPHAVPLHPLCIEPVKLSNGASAESTQPILSGPNRALSLAYHSEISY